tara:strand:+ start:465 stop:1004 length:540 start_codon:yes stop_codon:yes gene_type:complete
MKTPPRKKRDELTMRELRDLERREEAERQDWDRENEARIHSLDTRTEIQQTIIDNIERDIHICKHKIDDMKEDFRAYERSSTFVDDLEELYGELGILVGKRDVVKHFGFNEPLQTDTSHRNPSWVVSETNSDPHFTVGYEDDNALSMDTDYNPFSEALVRGVLGEVDYDAQLDRLNKDL